MPTRYWRGLCGRLRIRAAMTVETLHPGSAGAPAAPAKRRLARHRLEWPTLFVALAIHGGYLMLTAFFRELPLLVSVPLMSLLLAWYSSLQHETIHGHPTPSRRFNAALGGLPLALWIPYTVYR